MPVCLFLRSVQGDSSTVTTVADSSKSLASTFFRIKGNVTGYTYMFWFKVGGTGTSPATASDTPIEIDILEDATAATVATAIKTAADANYSFARDFTTDRTTDTLTFTALAGGCSNAHDGLSAFATHFTIANAATVPVLDAVNSQGIQSFVRTGAGLYTVTFGTPAPTSQTDIYVRLFGVDYTPVPISGAPTAAKMFVVSEAVASLGTIHLKFTAEDGTTAADPVCGDITLMRFFLKNSTAQ